MFNYYYYYHYSADVMRVSLVVFESHSASVIYRQDTIETNKSVEFSQCSTFVFR